MSLFKQAGKEKGPIPIKGIINGKPYIQTLVKYSGAWRLYINTTMLKNSPKLIGETIEITVEFDPIKRVVEQHPKLIKALKENKEAKAIFDNLNPSSQNEIVRYISNLKSEESIDRNVNKAINFLFGRERFVGREKP
ncbi:MAG: YdeI/OmpD-associated family protein [Bacteroidota bacterium]